MFYFLTLLALQTTPVVLHPRIVEVAVYKPGLVYVTREATVPKGLGLYTLDRIPQALDGSLWYRSPDKAKVSELRTTINLKATTETTALTSIPQVLANNVGKNVRLQIQIGSKRESISGRLLRFEGQAGKVTLKLANGNLRSLSGSSVVEVSTNGLKMSSSRQGAKVAMQFRIDATKLSKIQFVSLESGAAWIANYRLDIKGAVGNLESSAALGLGSLSLKGAHVRLVSGLPTLNGAKRLDLMVGALSVANFASGSGTDISFGGDKDPYEVLLGSPSGSPFIGGSMPDGLFRGASYNGTVHDADDLMKRQVNYPSTIAAANLPQFLRDTVAASRLEDLHIYDFGSVTLPAGGRLQRVLSETKAPLKTVYRWDAVKPGDPGPFYRTLRVKNEGKSSWPAGGVFVVSNEIPLAQLAFPFTPSGQEASLVLGSAEDLLTQYDVSEISRREISPRPNVLTAEVTYEATLTATNTRQETISVEVGLEAVGEVVAAGGATTSVVGIQGTSKQSTKYTWHGSLAPGEKRTFTARFKSKLMD